MIFEVLFCLVMNEFKNRKNYIIDKTIIEIEIKHKIVLERIEIELQVICFEDIQIGERITQYHYEEQSELLSTLNERVKEKKEVN